MPNCILLLSVLFHCEGQGSSEGQGEGSVKVPPPRPPPPSRPAPPPPSQDGRYHQTAAPLHSGIFLLLALAQKEKEHQKRTALCFFTLSSKHPIIAQFIKTPFQKREN